MVETVLLTEPKIFIIWHCTKFLESWDDGRGLEGLKTWVDFWGTFFLSGDLGQSFRPSEPEYLYLL